MEIGTITHKALRRFVETGNARGLPGDVSRIRNMIAYIAAIEEIAELYVPPNFGAHQLGGDRAGTWSLTVTRNWRMTFRLDAAGAIVDLDLEDYH
ncbi:type II toxin-antitoxin system RelE/ParE family toxin [Sphingomonas profundi]|uniref:type II toxin-antitoxin system RelE/ParE family toxin n=1 Tax=Alterirhizorhabdus profundi TaxID=2681549 RepID=UPI0012E952BE|nr:type II toxin-antitoxin system RelE/ParE family toxin [Sphingomonas profundi]